MSGFKLDIDSVEKDEDRVEFLSACSKLDQRIICNLVDVKGVDAETTLDTIGQNAIHLVAVSSAYDTERQISLIGYLIQQGANVNQQRTSDGWTPLFLAVTFGLQPIVNALLQSGAKTMIKDHQEMTPEDYADKFRMKQIKDMLVHR